MLLYILRHAEAEPKTIPDWERRLTPHGHEQARKMGNFCLERKLIPEVILTSPVVRARQTAEGFVAVLKKGELIEVPWMACGMHPEVALKEFQAYMHFDSVMLVGHEPDLSHLIACLLGVKSAAALDVRKASLTAIEVKRLAPGAGALQFFIPCEIVS